MTSHFSSLKDTHGHLFLVKLTSTLKEITKPYFLLLHYLDACHCGHPFIKNYFLHVPHHLVLSEPFRAQVIFHYSLPAQSLEYRKCLIFICWCCVCVCEWVGVGVCVSVRERWWRLGGVHAQVHSYISIYD